MGWSLLPALVLRGICKHSKQPLDALCKLRLTHPNYCEHLAIHEELKGIMIKQSFHIAETVQAIISTFIKTKKVSMTRGALLWLISMTGLHYDSLIVESLFLHNNADLIHLFLNIYRDDIKETVVLKNLSYCNLDVFKIAWRNFSVRTSFGDVKRDLLRGTGDIVFIIMDLLANKNYDCASYLCENEAVHVADKYLLCFVYFLIRSGDLDFIQRIELRLHVLTRLKNYISSNPDIYFQPRCNNIFYISYQIHSLGANIPMVAAYLTHNKDIINYIHEEKKFILDEFDELVVKCIVMNFFKSEECIWTFMHMFENFVNYEPSRNPEVIKCILRYDGTGSNVSALLPYIKENLKMYTLSEMISEMSISHIGIFNARKVVKPKDIKLNFEDIVMQIWIRNTHPVRVQKIITLARIYSAQPDWIVDMVLFIEKLLLQTSFINRNRNQLCINKLLKFLKEDFKLSRDHFILDKYKLLLCFWKHQHHEIFSSILRDDFNISKDDIVECGILKEENAYSKYEIWASFGFDKYDMINYGLLQNYLKQEYTENGGIDEFFLTFNITSDDIKDFI